MRFNYKIEKFKKETMKSLITVLILLSGFEAPAQKVPSGANNNDLRNSSELFSITSTNFVYRFESSVNGQFSLNYYEQSKLKGSWKVDTEAASKLDADFADRFIALKYEMQGMKNKKCSKKFSLSMRGEGQNICGSEKEKIKLLENFINDLKKRFS